MYHQIDSLAYTNKLRSLFPEHKIAFAISLCILGYITPPLVQILIIFWLIWWLVYYAQIPALIYFKLLALPISFLLISLPALIVGICFSSQVLMVKNDIIIGIKLGEIYLYLSEQGLAQAQQIFWRGLSLTSCMYFILLTTPFTDIIRVLRKCKFPLLLIELLFLMYRFIFILAETASELLIAQRSRFGYHNWQRGMRSLSILIGQLLWRSLENYRQVSLGLISRGFNGELKVWQKSRYQINRRYLIEAIAGYGFLLTSSNILN